MNQFSPRPATFDVPNQRIHWVFSRWTFGLMLAMLAGCGPLSSPLPAPPPPTATGTASPSPSLSPSPTPSVQKSEVTQTIETKLLPLVAKATNLTVSRVECPAEMAAIAGKRYDCQVTSDAGEFPVNVELTNAQGQFQWSPKGLLLMAKLEEYIQKSIQNRGGGKVTANCGESSIRVTKPKDEFECTVTDAAGQKRAVKVTVQNEQGNVFLTLL